MCSTKKLYYFDNNMFVCNAKIINIHESAIEVDQTIAYPEGGGQEGDQGMIFLAEKPEVRIFFTDTKASISKCKTGVVILHYVINTHDLKLFNREDKVCIKIDYIRRKMLSTSHSAIHIIYWAIDLFKKGIVENTIGCHINTDTARLDFSVLNRFTKDDIDKIEAIANEIIDQGYKIKINSSDHYKNIRYWVCENYIIPCGGTHVNNTKEIPYIQLRRKNIGKGKERIMFVWRNNEDIIK